jgi:hypothetical protein
MVLPIGSGFATYPFQRKVIFVYLRWLSGGLNGHCCMRGGLFTTKVFPQLANPTCWVAISKRRSLPASNNSWKFGAVPDVDHPKSLPIQQTSPRILGPCAVSRDNERITGGTVPRAARQRSLEERAESFFVRSASCVSPVGFAELSQPEVLGYLLGFETDFTKVPAWTWVHLNSLGLC